MKRYITILAMAAMSLSAAAQTTPHWLRQSAISPDGKTIAFAYQGDIYTVPANGGEARQITTNPAHEADPKWTADGQKIVFSSYRELSKDIYVVNAKGGEPTRLTNYTGNETPLTVLPDGYVLFSANIQNSASFTDYPGDPQVYKVSINGGRVIPVTDITMQNISVNADGVLLYEDYKGYEDYLRKHHTSSVTRDIWMQKGSEFTKLSSFKGENRNPVFAADGDSFYYLSEQDGVFNVWKSSISKPAACSQVTSFKTHPVRNLSIASDGTLLFSWNGDLYTCKEGAEPKMLAVSITKDVIDRNTIRRSINTGITAASASPNGKEVAIVAHGDVFVTSSEFSTTHRITNTPSQERGVSFSADGRAIYYAAERDGHWGIWRTVLTDKKDKYFTYSYNTKEELFSDKGETCFQPSVSPDGKWVAFLRDRTDICIKPTKGGPTKALLSGVNYSYSDGDQSFEWSPDSHYILCDYMGNGGWNNSDVALIDIETGQITNLTQSGYSDGSFHWAMKGKAMVWQSDKNGYRSHGSWGAENDSYVMFFDPKTFFEFTRDKEADEIEKLLNPKEEKKKEKEEEKEKKDSAKVKSTPKTVLDLDNREFRTVRLTRSSSRMGDHYLTNDGIKLFYVSNGELFRYNTREKLT
ncbi:MAG: PD40 domain-containing protein, partial [Bacteroidales bacterium]|nr:PD40 domain-containing protein [Candidatus Cryptobacteroides equifaecalis]